MNRQLNFGERVKSSVIQHANYLTEGLDSRRCERYRAHLIQRLY